MSIRQFAFCVLLAPFLCLFFIGSVVVVFPVMIAVSWLCGDQEPVSGSWETCTVPPIEMIREGWSGKL